MIGFTTLTQLAKLRDFKSRRVSSFAKDGSNRDYWSITPGKEITLADIKGPGCIKHIWMTLGLPTEDYNRRIVLRMYWDGKSQPSVECPIGDFFGIGHGIRKNFCSLPLQMSPQAGKGFNSWWAMPFRQQARITVTNEADMPYVNYFYVDYEQYDRPEDDLAYFHVQWRRENPTKGWGDELPEAGGKHQGGEARERWHRRFVEAKNVTGKDNYIILDAKGNGHYLGCHLDIDCFRREKNDWYGEGDDMIFVDGERWPPEIHGTGTEDYFNMAYCPRQEYCSPYFGLTLYSGTPDWPWKGKNSCYRYHIEDPIRFRKSILVTIEHGHANNLSNDYSSTAYYYLSQPKQAGPKLPPVAKRLPRPAEPEYQVRLTSKRR